MSCISSAYLSSVEVGWRRLMVAARDSPGRRSREVGLFIRHKATMSSPLVLQVSMPVFHSAQTSDQSVSFWEGYCVR